ncbi:MAG: S41 family peptidase [Defluviitaleaceae bacterium]|nr:S41 family peptidase [Defluviitaleaceae bacterium]
MKKTNYIIGMFTGMVIMLAVYVGLSIFFPGILNTDERAVAAQSRREPESFQTVGAKIDHILAALDAFYLFPIDMDELSDQIFRAVVNLLGDPYTQYMSEAQFQAFMQEAEGVFYGIGVQVSACAETNRIIVIVPFEDTPAAEAGILPGDAIINVNGTDVFGETMSQAVDMIRGPLGTEVTVTFYRPSTGETFEREITRARITVPTTTHRMIEETDNNNIGYIRITRFDRVTSGQFRDALRELEAEGMEGLIIDLRNNPGGLLQQVLQIADWLVPRGTIVYTEDRNGVQRPVRSTANFLDIPIVVLINEGSASASEILAGALRDHDRATLVGMNSFGKGLVQNLLPMPDGSAIRITVEQYFTPNGTVINGIGLAPDYEIEMDIELTIRLSQLTLEEDVQLSKALEVLLQKME